MKRTVAASVLLLFVALGRGSSQQQKNSDHRSNPRQDEASVLMYRDGSGFFIDVPKGWVIDQEAGKRGGTCCVYYPQGSTFNDADTIMYPNIATKREGQRTLDEFMKSDLSRFLEHEPAMKYENAQDILLQNKRIAKIRLFHGVNRGSSEAVAYIDEEKIVALFVMSSRSERAFNESMPLFRSAVKTYTYMNVTVSPDAMKEEPGQRPRN